MSSPNETGRSTQNNLLHYFLEGNEHISAESIEQAGESISECLRINLSHNTDPAHSFRHLAYTLAQLTEQNNSHKSSEQPAARQGLSPQGGHYPPPDVENPDCDKINLACRGAFALIQLAFDDHLIEGGFSPDQASRLSTLLTASLEGAILLSRTFQSGEPLRLIGDQLSEFLLLTKES